jgi:hypothetical protein
LAYRLDLPKVIPVSINMPCVYLCPPLKPWESEDVVVYLCEPVGRSAIERSTVLDELRKCTGPAELPHDVSVTDLRTWMACEVYTQVDAADLEITELATAARVSTRPKCITR